MNSPLTQAIFIFQNFLVFIDPEYENKIFLHLAKTDMLANLELEIYVVKFWAL